MSPKKIPEPPERAWQIFTHPLNTSTAAYTGITRKTRGDDLILYGNIIDSATYYLHIVDVATR